VSRLYDRIMAMEDKEQPLNKNVLDNMKLSEVVVADNVCDYYYFGTTQEYWPVEEFVLQVPPFRSMFIEMRPPNFTRSEEFGVRRWGSLDKGPAPRAWGALVQSVDRKSFRGYDGFEFNLDGERMMKLPDSTRWVVSMGLVLEFEKYRPGSFDYAFCLFVDEDGTITRTADGKPHIMAQFLPGAVLKNPASELPLEQGKQLAGQLCSFIHPIMLTISFMNCKNVSTSYVESPPKLSRSFEKEHGVPLVRYKVLEIGEMRRYIHQQGEGHTASSVKKALHICRGHFKTFSEEKPLLGRATGTFWWSQQLRGSKESGLVVKDYKMKIPEVCP